MRLRYSKAGRTPPKVSITELGSTMSKKTIAVISIILIVFALAVWVLVPINGERFGKQGMRLGLDLVGGVHLVYRIVFRDDATNE